MTDNRFDWFGDAESPFIVVIAGWATGPKLVDCLTEHRSGVVVTPFNPESLVEEVVTIVGGGAIRVQQVVGVSIGADMAMRLAERWQVPWCGIGANTGFAIDELGGLEFRLTRSVDAAIRGFLCAALGDRRDRQWTLDAVSQVGWDMESLRRGLRYLAVNHWQDRRIFPGTFIHGECDGIAPIGPIQRLAADCKCRLVTLPGRGHLPFGPFGRQGLLELLWQY